MANPNPTPRPDNLAPWKPGQSGNPGGRPKILTISDSIRAALNKKALMGIPVPLGMDALEALGEAIVYHAIQGSAPYTNIALDRTEGKVPNPNEFSHVSDEELLEQIKGEFGGGGEAGTEAQPEG